MINMDGGFSGKRDPVGTVVQQGWIDYGLPVSKGDGDERSYSDLLEVAADAQQEE